MELSLEVQGLQRELTAALASLNAFNRRFEEHERLNAEARVQLGVLTGQVMALEITVAAGVPTLADTQRRIPSTPRAAFASSFAAQALAPSTPWGVLRPAAALGPAVANLIPQIPRRDSWGHLLCPLSAPAPAVQKIIPSSPGRATVAAAVPAVKRDSAGALDVPMELSLEVQGLQRELTAALASLNAFNRRFEEHERLNAEARVQLGVLTGQVMALEITVAAGVPTLADTQRRIPSTPRAAFASSFAAQALAPSTPWGVLRPAAALGPAVANLIPQIPRRDSWGHLLCPLSAPAPAVQKIIPSSPGRATVAAAVPAVDASDDDGEEPRPRKWCRTGYPDNAADSEYDLFGSSGPDEDDAALSYGL